MKLASSAIWTLSKLPTLWSKMWKWIIDKEKDKNWLIFHSQTEIKTCWYFFFVCVCMSVRERKGAPLCVRKRKWAHWDCVCVCVCASKCVWEKNTAGSKVKGESMWKQRHQRKKWRDSQEMDKVELWSRWGWLRLQGYILIWNQWSHPPMSHSRIYNRYKLWWKRELWK